MMSPAPRIPNIQGSQLDILRSVTVLCGIGALGRTVIVVALRVSVDLL
jgi:hypothetical protein